ncbi:hypothetical protein ACFL0O_03910 [Thermodesulfobacteriota bacterium]
MALNLNNRNILKEQRKIENNSDAAGVSDPALMHVSLKRKALIQSLEKANIVPTMYLVRAFKYRGKSYFLTETLNTDDMEDVDNGKKIAGGI